MKKIILSSIIALLILSGVNANAQALNWQWAKSAGGTTLDAGYSISTDAGGNVLVTGSFFADSITFGSTTLINAGGGNADIFVVKYDASGNALWAKSAGGTSSDDEGLGISTDASGNVLVTGFFSSPTITFGSTTLTNAGSRDIFVVKYDASGNALWAKSAGGTSSDDRGFAISTDASGNVLVTGSFQSSSITFGSTTLTNAGSTDIFVAKLNGVVGINELSFSQPPFRIYPNPTTGEFGVSSTEFGEGRLDIYNIVGEQVYSQIINQKSEIINPQLPSAVYFIKVSNSEKASVQKLVVQ